MKLRQFLEGQRKNRKSLNRIKRLNLWKRCHGLCWYCGTKTPRTWFILDHVEPFSKGGADSPRNLVVSCPPCDREKGAMTLEEFRARRGGLRFFGEIPPEFRVKLSKPEKHKPMKTRVKWDYDNMPGTVAALMIAERGKYVREPYRF